MKKINVLFVLAMLILSGCSPLRYQSYNIPKNIITPHEEVMSRFDTKTSVVMKFGTPTDQFTIDSITVFSFDLGTIETGSSNSISITNGSSAQSSQSVDQSYFRYSGLAMTRYNPLYSVNNPLQTNGASVSVSNNFSISRTMSSSRTESFHKTVKFWFIGNNVIKWETDGVDMSESKPNPAYDVEAENAFYLENQRVAQKKQIRGFLSIVGPLTVIISLIAAFY